MVLKSNKDKEDRESTIADVDPTLRSVLTVESTHISALTQNLYTLSVIDLSSGRDAVAISDTPLAPTGASSVGDQYTAEFTFRVPPKSHEFSEPFATTIQPTQNGGKFVETQGSILKEVRLSGTTGLRPHKDSPRNLPLLGGAARALASSDTLASLGATVAQLGRALTGPRPIGLDEVIGHDEIIFLRNLFRFYSDKKSSNQVSSNTIMVWRNIKDGDYWIVEPTEFRLSQSSSSPLTYDYAITLKTITTFDFSFSLSENDPLLRLNSPERVFNRVTIGIRELTNTFLQISQRKGKFSQLSFDIEDSILKPMANVLTGLAGVRSSSPRKISLLQTNTKQMNRNITEILPTLEAAFETQDPDVRALRRAVITGSSILTDDKLKPSVGASVTEKADEIKEAYQKPAGASTPRRSPATGGSKSFIGNQPTPNSIGQDTVHTGEDLRDIAGRVLGDRSQWHILAVLNVLEAPYISEGGGRGVLKPGDTVLFPRSGPGVSTSISSLSESEAETEEKDNKSQGSMQQSYGRDIRILTTNTASNIVTADIRPNNLGDISTIQGIPNVGQAIKIKFATERGELPAHPSYGVQFKLGSRATPQSLAGFRIAALSTLLSDNRIKDVRELNITAFADVLVLSASLLLRDSNKALKTKLPIRRFS